MVPATSAQLDANLAYVQGDTWGGIPSITISSAPAYTAQSAIFGIKVNLASVNPIRQLTSEAGEITISDATNWIFAIPAQTLVLPAGSYVWQFRVTDSNGSIQTYIQGSLQVLLQCLN